MDVARFRQLNLILPFLKEYVPLAIEIAKGSLVCDQESLLAPPCPAGTAESILFTTLLACGSCA